MQKPSSDTPSRPLPEKKSEKLEVRMTLAEKNALRAEATSKGISISELVRQILTDHISAQPFWQSVTTPLQNHPRKASSIFVGIFAAIGLGAATIPFAAAQNVTVDISGMVERKTDDIRTSRSFKSALYLELGKQGVLTLPPSPEVEGSKPVEIEIVVSEADPHTYKSKNPVYLFTMRIIEDHKTIAAPKLVAEENTQAKIVHGLDPNHKYTITAIVNPD